MKKIFTEGYRLRLFVLSLITMVSSISYASDFEIDGIEYTINSDGKTVEIAKYKIYEREDLMIPETVTFDGVEYVVSSIGDKAFWSSELHNLKIPSSVTTIRSNAFWCTKLHSLSIPNSLTIIENSAFWSCKVDSVIVSEMEIPIKLEGFGFDVETYQKTQLLVPMGRLEKYTTTKGWHDFVNIAEYVDSINTYSLSVKSTGNGSISYNDITIRNRASTIAAYKGSTATFIFAPDKGYRIKQVIFNNMDITNSIQNNSYTTAVDSNISIEVEFEALPSTTYQLSISSQGKGTVLYNGESIREGMSIYTVYEGSDVVLTFTPDYDNQLNYVKVNGSNVEISNNSYSIKYLNYDVSVEALFEEIVNNDVIRIEDINYQVISYDDHLLMVDGGDYGKVLEVPEKANYNGEEWTITGIVSNALINNDDLAAVIWNPECQFSGKVRNPNILLYVKDEAYAPSEINNVVVNGFAKAITLTDAQSGNNFYCPSAFTAQSIIYIHNYSMKTGLNESKGWETIALPFDVQQISHSSKGDIVPFTKWTSDDATKPFWLFELSGRGFIEADGIRANRPYIISMPNNDNYPIDYQLSGRVTFSALNAEVKKSDDTQVASFNNKSFVPNFTCQEANDGIYALNVRNDNEAYSGGENEGSKFILNLRKIHPFEAYMTSTSNARAFEIFDDMKTAIRGIEEIGISQKQVKVYDLSGKLLKEGASLDAVKQELPSGVYILNNKKIIIK